MSKGRKGYTSAYEMGGHDAQIGGGPNGRISAQDRASWRRTFIAAETKRYFLTWDYLLCSLVAVPSRFKGIRKWRWFVYIGLLIFRVLCDIFSKI